MQTSRTIFHAALQERQSLAVTLLAEALSRRSLANSYLLVGAQSADKGLIAKQLASILNCRFGWEESCPAVERHPYCTNCQWISDEAHPGAFIVLSGETDSGKIPVEKARALTAELGKTSQYWRVVIIPDARTGALHDAPANCLLKSIEEPPAGSVFLLFADSAEAVLPTIVSRSQVLRVQGQFRSLEKFEEDRSELVAKAQPQIDAAVKNFLGAKRTNADWKRASEVHQLVAVLDGLTEDEGITAQEAIDLVLSACLRSLWPRCLSPGGESRFLHEAARVCEVSRQQLERYVKKMNAVESLGYALDDLRAKHLGD